MRTDSPAALDDVDTDVSHPSEPFDDPVCQALFDRWQALGYGAFEARGLAEERMMPGANGLPIPYAPDAPTPVTASPTPEPAPDPALEHARAQVRDSQVRRHVLTWLWRQQGHAEHQALGLAESDRIPDADGGERAWDTQDDAQVRQCMATGRLKPLAPEANPSEPARPAPESATEPTAHAPATPEPEPVPTPDPEPEPTPTPERATGPSYGWDKLPKAVTRDRHLTAEAVRLYALLLDLSDNRTHLASKDQATLATWMGFSKKGGRDRVRRLLESLQGRRYLELVRQGRKQGPYGIASTYRVHRGSLTLASADDVQGKGLVDGPKEAR